MSPHQNNRNIELDALSFFVIAVCLMFLPRLSVSHLDGEPFAPTLDIRLALNFIRSAQRSTCSQNSKSRLQFSRSQYHRQPRHDRLGSVCGGA